MKEVKPLVYHTLDGLSEKQLKEHHDILYAGYVKRWNEIQEKLQTADRAASNATYSEYRELKLEETFAGNGIRLHEGYFDNMTPGGSRSSGELFKWIEEDFGSYARWEEDFRALGLAARGWVILAMDLESGKLTNVLCESHNQGGVWNSVALLIMDVYEHAYFIDYGAGRKAYIDSFFKNIDWEALSGVMARFRLSSFRGS